MDGALWEPPIPQREKLRLTYRPAQTPVWEGTQSTGDGAEVSGREPVVFEAISTIDQEAVSAVVRFIAVECL